MPDDRSQWLSADQAADDWLAEEQPDLAPLRALADGEELADAVSCLASEYGLPLRADDPLAPLARELATTLTLAGLTLHHCARSHPCTGLAACACCRSPAGPAWRVEPGSWCPGPRTASCPWTGTDGVSTAASTRR
jgi:hypothetical protein